MEPLLKEYIRFLPYSTYTCASFLLEMVEPHGLSTEEILNREPNHEELITDISTRGGVVVDRELAHQLKEFYEMATKYNVNCF